MTGKDDHAVRCPNAAVTDDAHHVRISVLGHPDVILFQICPPGRRLKFGESVACFFPKESVDLCSGQTDRIGGNFSRLRFISLPEAVRQRLLLKTCAVIKNFIQIGLPYILVGTAEKPVVCHVIEKAFETGELFL